MCSGEARRKGPIAQRPAFAHVVLRGENDACLEHHAALELCDDGRLSVIEGATHWRHPAQPERVNAELIRSLATEGDDGLPAPAAEPGLPGQ